MKVQRNIQTRATEHDQLSRRAIVGFMPKSADRDRRRVRFQLSSETPIEMFDFERGEVFPEILLTSGMRLPKCAQIPLQDTHDRSTVKKTLGSVREIQPEDGVPLGWVYFARDTDSEDAMNKVLDGHITDGSVGYKVLAAVYVERGAAYVHEGKTYQGPCKLATEWLCKEFSLAPIGADEEAKVRAETVKATPNAPEKAQEPVTASASRAEKSSGGRSMNKKLYALLLARGLPVGSTVAEATTFLETLADKDAIRAESEKPDEPQVNTDEIRARAEAETLARVAEITESCRAVGLPDEFSTKLVKEAKTIDQARAAIITELKKKNVPVSGASNITMGETDTEKFRAAAVDGLIARGDPQAVSKMKLAPGFESFRGRSLLRLAEECLQRAGVNTRNMTNREIAAAALRMRGAYTIAAGTADFPSIVLDASNKSLQRGFNEGPRNWSRFCNIGSAPDFKTINRISLFEAQDLKDIDEQGNYKEAIFKDGNETYSIDDKGLRFTISRKAIINDDTGAFSRIPRLLGVSGTRTIERAAYAKLTGGTTTVVMSDGKALFHADHNNITTSAALDADALAADIKAMATQKGRGEDGATTPCGAMPRFLHIPWALKYLADSLVAATSTYGGFNALANALEVLPSPFLDLNSATRRYLSADPNQADVIEVSFLDGVQEPFMEEVDQTDADGRVFKIRLDVGVGVLDWRGLLTNAGTD